MPQPLVCRFVQPHFRPPKNRRTRCDLLYDGNEITVPIFPVELKKPFGAGDAYMGGLIAELLAGGSVETAAQFGAAAAAIVVSRVGCASAMPTRNEVLEFITSRSEA